MKVTIITVTYNSEKYLQDCINSIKNQDYYDIEHIIIDGLSTDGTLDIVKRNGNFISKWVSEKDNGMYDAINKGMQMSTGDIIGILNSDDILADTDVISKIAECFTNKQINSIYGDLYYVDTLDTNKVLRVWKGQTYKRHKFSYGWMPAHPTFYIRRSLVDKLGGYESHYYTAADFEFMTRYLFKNRVSSFYLPKLIVKMRVGGQSNITFARRLRANRRDYLAMKKNNIPFPFVVSVLKPLRKVPQFYNSFLNLFV